MNSNAINLRCDEAVFSATLIVKNALKGVGQIVEDYDDIDNICTNSQVLLEKFVHINEAKKKLDTVLQELDNGNKSIGNTIQDMTFQLSRDEENLEKLKKKEDYEYACYKRRETDLENVLKEVDKAKAELSKNEQRLKPLERKKTRQDNEDFLETIGRTTVWLVGSKIPIFPADVVKEAEPVSTSELDFLKDVVSRSEKKLNDTKEDVEISKRVVDYARDRWYNLYKEIPKKKEILVELGETCQKINRYRAHIVNMSLMLAPIIGSIESLKETLRNHNKIGIHKSLNELTINGFENLVTECEKLTKQATYRLVMEKIEAGDKTKALQHINNTISNAQGDYRDKRDTLNQMEDKATEFRRGIAELQPQMENTRIVDLQLEDITTSVLPQFQT